MFCIFINSYNLLIIIITISFLFIRASTAMIIGLKKKKLQLANCLYIYNIRVQ